MPKPTKGPRLGGGPAHERLMLANLSAALFTHKSIQTTQTKAKRLRPLAERLITFAKRGDLHARRRVLSVIGDKEVVHILFTEIAPLVAERQGGYTRITKIGNRKGDNAPMAVIELVLEPVAPKTTSTSRSVKPAARPADAVAADSDTADAADTVTVDADAADTPVESTEETVDTGSSDGDNGGGDAEEAEVSDDRSGADETDDSATAGGAESPEEGEAAEAAAEDAVVDGSDQTDKA